MVTPGGLSGRTRVFPILGDPIAQVRSPRGVTAVMRGRGLDAVVVPLQVAREDFEGLLSALSRSKSVGGVLVTVPHKFQLAKLCGHLSERAMFSRSASVARLNLDGTWDGDQLDGVSCVAAMIAGGAKLTGARALQVGAGGAGSAIALALLEAGVGELAICDVNHLRREELVSRLKRRFPDQVGAASHDPDGFSIIVNATPLGMKTDDPLPVDVSRLSRSAFVGCVVTEPAIPPLIREARALGCRTSTGNDMFLQGQDLIADFLCTV